MSLTVRHISEADPAVFSTIAPRLISPELPQTPMISKNNELEPLLPRLPVERNRRRWLGLATPALIIPFVLSSSIAVSHCDPTGYLSPPHTIPSVAWSYFSTTRGSLYPAW